MDQGHHLIWIVTVPALVAGAASVLWLFAGRYWGTTAGLVLLAVGFAVGFYGFHGGLLLPPRLTFHWLPIVAAAAALSAVMLRFPSTCGRLCRFGFPAALAISSIVAAIGSLPQSMMTPLHIAGVFLLPFLLVLPARMAGDRLHPGSVLAWAFMAFSMAGACLLLSGTARMGQLSGIVPSMILALGWLAWVRPGNMDAQALLLFFVPLYVAFLVVGTHSVSLSPVRFAFLAPTALAMGAARLPWKGTSHPMVVLALAGAIGGVAVFLAWRVHPGFV